LEIDLGRLLRLGLPILVTGIGQVALSVLLGLGIFLLLGFYIPQGRFDALFLAAAVSMSSTMIVVKLLYDKKELDTLAGRITVGILVVQDLYAILFIAILPDLDNPDFAALASSLLKGVGVVATSFLVSRYLLPKIFALVARQPELGLLTGVAWCFVIAGLADYAGLSREMGALIAGVSISSFPYRRDISNRVVSLRDFFITLFFVSLGMQIPQPTGQLVVYAVAAAGFVLVSRFLTIFPFLYIMRQGIQVSVLTSINLAQVSEFSLVLVALGTASGHIAGDTASVIVLAMILTSTLSTYMIQHSHRLFRWSEPALAWLGLHERLPVASEVEEASTQGQQAEKAVV